MAISEYPPRTTDLPLTVFDERLETIMQTQINLLGKIERHLAIVTEEDIDDDEILMKE